MKKSIILSSALAISIMFSSVASAATYDQYTAKDNDMLWKVSNTYGVSLSSLMEINPKIDPYNIYKGLIINIPNKQNQNWELNADAMIAKGMTQLGVPYVFGGDRPYEAFDCSGFTQYMFRAIGIELPHSSAMQSDLGKFVPANQLRKGDLIFLSDTYQAGVSHVALYIGDNKVLQAGTMGTREVKISTLFGTPYYDSHYWGARRLID
ncbi:LysM domain-containing protein [Paenibacillus sp. 1_12]|uniref:C40 family peptidase n=1 Tax=Paenibacillus sp. 1_12 TaxID=1566278 RepID=UPI0008E3E0A5|nr:LysM peptidoglycan-binding domain-containing C40 family peptidase [Paenibacillus sp. 1_12]SFM17245.1 LysM domain-containing protein [Paenibacillus sp. 1_12]